MPSEPQSTAAAAFDALRVEVGETRADLRKLAKRIADKQVPDYDLTLGEMAKRLTAMEKHLDFLSRAVPPAKLPIEIYLPHQLHALTEQATAAARELSAATGVMIEQRAIRWWLVGSGGVGVLAGLLLCLGTAALLPRQAGAWMAADIVGGDPWTAGQALMRQADPVRFGRMIQLDQACPQDASTELCRAAMAVKAAMAAPGR